VEDPGVAGAARSDEPMTTGLAAKIDYLFKTVYPAGRGPYSYKEAAAGIERATGEAVSDTTLWKLRTGKSDNPTKRIIEGLAAFFGVNPAYFFDDEAAKAVGHEVELLAVLRDAGMRGAQLRSLAELSPQALDMVAQLIESTAELERQHQRKKRGGKG
jgi:ESX-1-secreted protein regulator